MKLNKIKYLFLFLLLLFEISFVEAQNFKLEKEVFGNGGGKGTSTNYVLNGTLGQTLAGVQTSATLKKEIGFWNQFLGIPTAVNDLKLNAELDKNHSFRAYPNPFSQAVNLQFNLDNQEWVSIKIYDSSGNNIKTIVEDVLPGQQHHFTFYAEGLPNGMYYCKVQTIDSIIAEKISLIR